MEEIGRIAISKMADGEMIAHVDKIECFTTFARTDGTYTYIVDVGAFKVMADSGKDGVVEHRWRVIKND